MYSNASIKIITISTKAHGSHCMLSLLQGDKGDQGDKVRKDNIMKGIKEHLNEKTTFQILTQLKNIYGECNAFISS